MQDKAGFSNGDTVIIEITSESIFIRPAKRRGKLPFTESELLRNMTPHSAHTDELPNFLPTEWGMTEDHNH